MTDLIQQYMNYPMLSEQEERDLIDCIFKHGCVESTKKLAQSYLKLVVDIAYKWKSWWANITDLVHEGCIGLLSAIKNFNPSHNVRFGSYARNYIKYAIVEYVMDNTKIVKIGTTKEIRKCLFNLNSYKEDNQVPFTNEQAEHVAKELGVQVSTIREVEARLAIRYDPLYSDDGEVIDIADHTSPEDIVADVEWEEVTMQKVRKVIDSFDDRTREIIHHRFMSEKKKSFAQLAKEYGVSTARVDEIEKNAIKKIRQAIGDV